MENIGWQVSNTAEGIGERVVNTTKQVQVSQEGGGGKKGKAYEWKAGQEQALQDKGGNIERVGRKKRHTSGQYKRAGAGVKGEGRSKKGRAYKWNAGQEQVLHKRGGNKRKRHTSGMPAG